MRNIIVGIDVGTSLTRVVISTKNKEDYYPHIVGIGSAPSSGLRHGYITNIDEASNSIKQAISDAEKNTGMKIRSAYVCIGGVSLFSENAIGTSIVSRADKEVTQIDVNNALDESADHINLTNRKVLQRVPLAYKLDGHEITGRPTGMNGIKLEIKTLFITCLSQHLEDLLKAVANAGVEVLDVIASPVSTAGIILSERQKAVGVGIIDIGAETMSITIFENGLPYSLAVFSIGSIEITKDIAIGLKIPYEEAENIKTGRMIGDFPKKKLEEIIQARLSDIFEIADSYLKKQKRRALLPAGIIVIGGGGQYQFIEELGKEILNLPVKSGNPDIWNSSSNRLPDQSWFSSAGLCAGNFGNGFDQTEESVGVKALIISLKKWWKNIFHQLMP